MTATYPSSVKSFTAKTDAVSTVFAADVDGLQDEVTAIERTVGTNPASWAGVTLMYPPHNWFTVPAPLAPYAGMTAPATYASVADRLNQLQAQVAWLTAVANRTPGAGGPVVRTPVSIISSTGFPYLPGFANWQFMPWGATAYDPNSMFQGGTDIPCPQTGWWKIALQVWSDVAQIPGIHHANVRLLVNGVEAGTDGSQIQVGVVDAHRMNLSWEGPWSAGQLISAQFSHAPGDGNNSAVNARSTISLSYLRDIS